MPAPTKSDIKAALLAGYAAKGFTMVPDPNNPGQFVLDEVADAQATAIHNFWVTWQGVQVVTGTDAVTLAPVVGNPTLAPPTGGLP